MLPFWFQGRNLEEASQEHRDLFGSCREEKSTAKHCTNPGVPLVDDTPALGILVNHCLVLCSIACATIYIWGASATRHDHLLANADDRRTDKNQRTNGGASLLFAQYVKTSSLHPLKNRLYSSFIVVHGGPLC